MEEQINERLYQVYEQICMVEMRPLRDFVLAVKSGAYGEFSTDEVVEFLRWIESNMLQNIQMKAMEGQRFADMADQAAEETSRLFEELIAELEKP
ncbi:MAG: hypothetical protein HY660_09885 [Armatimonadetes bacterium]|nr:hypothetical protein [Armatimonadota bacterium]